MVKLRFFMQAILAVGFLALPLLAGAHEKAPVEDLSVNSVYASPQSGGGGEQTDSPADNLEAVSQQGASRDDFDHSPSPSEYSESHAESHTEDDESGPAARIDEEESSSVASVMPAASGSHSVEAGDRIARLEQQVTNLINMNLPEQLSQLQQTLQELNGRLQEEEHELQRLKAQQHDFYEEINRRLQKTESAAPPEASSSSVVSQFSSELSKLMPTSSPSDVSHSENSEDALAYHRAFKLLVDKRYKEAIVAFNDYITRYKDSVFIANAYYWLGELYLKKGNIDVATHAFSQVVEQYPESNKVSDAKLKLAMIHLRQGQQSVARHEFETIKRQYPGSTAAQLASIQLQTMALQ